MDLNEYYLFELPNKMKCLLINDRNSPPTKGHSMATVSTSVGAGSMNDPMSRQGTAHFLEHMAFLGSKKYPKNKLFELTQANGGGTNAYTAFEVTNY